jgi:uncharacterized protein (DUF1778 family)
MRRRARQQIKGPIMSTAAALERPRETSQRRDAVINVRLPTKLRDLIDRAAHVVGKTRSDFILESAQKHAIDVLLDQRLFSLSPEQYDRFLRILDQPAEPNVRLKQLLASKSPWEK